MHIDETVEWTPSWWCKWVKMWMGAWPFSWIHLWYMIKIRLSWIHTHTHIFIYTITLVCLQNTIKRWLSIWIYIYIYIYIFLYVIKTQHSADGVLHSRDVRPLFSWRITLDPQYLYPVASLAHLPSEQILPRSIFNTPEYILSDPTHGAAEIEAMHDY